MTNQNTRTRDMILAALCLAIAMVLPFSDRTDTDHRKHAQSYAYSCISVRLHMRMEMGGCSRFCGAVHKICGFRHAATMPVGVGMAFEMLTYGLVAGLLYKILPKRR